MSFSQKKSPSAEKRERDNKRERESKSASHSHSHSQPSTPSNQPKKPKAKPFSTDSMAKMTPQSGSTPSANLNSTSPSKKKNKASKGSQGRKPDQPTPSQTQTQTQTQTPTSAQKTSTRKGINESNNLENKSKGKQVQGINQVVGEKKQSEKDAKNLRNLSWTAVVDGQVGEIPPLFTRDSDYYFQATSSSVRVHSRATGKVVSTLSIGSDSHTSRITGLIFNPANHLQLVTCSLDGTLKIWDYLEGILLKSIWVGLPITQLTASPNANESDPSVFVATRKPQSSSANGKIVDPFNHNGRCNSIVYSVSLSTQKGSSGSIKLPTNSGSRILTKRPKSLTRIGKMKETNDLKVSNDGKWLVAIGNKKIHVIDLSKLSSSESNSAGFTKISSDEQLTTLSFHPFQSVFATGDSKGRIRIWNFLMDEEFFKNLSSIEINNGSIERQVPSSILHWHSHSVSSLTFSPNGAYLASGGEEAVLVLWNLNQMSQKEFVPRLGAPIASISVAGPNIINQGNPQKASGEVEYVVALKDGSVSFVSSGNLRVSRSFARVKNDASIKPTSPAALSSLPLPLAIQPITGHLVLPSSHPSTIQFFSLSSDSHVQDLEIASSNRVSRPEETPIEPTRVERVVFSTDAKWMATLDSRRGGIGQMSENSLKFWRWNSKLKKYELNSRIEKPHSKGEITSMSFSPSSKTSSINDDGDDDETQGSSPLFVTTGTDLNTKTWRISSSKLKGGRIEKFWSVRSIFKYKNHLPSHASWSNDSAGSILAVAHADVVTLWETSSNSLIQVLTCPEIYAVKKVRFVGENGRFLAVLSKDHVVLWDLIMGDLVSSRKVEGKTDDLVKGERGTFVLMNKVNQKTSIVETFQPDEISNTGSFDPLESYSVPFALNQVLSFDSSMIHTSSIASTSREKLSSTSPPSLLASTSSRSIILFGSIASDLIRSSSPSTQSIKSIDLSTRSFFDELFGLNDSNEEETLQEIETRQKAERELSRSVFVSNHGDANKFKEIFDLFDSPSHLLPPINSLSDSLFHAILPPARKLGDGSLAASPQERTVGDEEDESDEDEEEDQMDVDPEFKDQSRNQKQGVRDDDVAMEQINSQDWNHLTDLFKKNLSTTSSSVEGSKSSEATPKTKSKPNGISTPSQEASGGGAKKKQKSVSSSNTPVRGNGKTGQK